MINKKKTVLKLSFLTISKAYVLALIAFVIMVVIFVFVKKFNHKEKVWKDVIGLISVSCLAVITCFPHILSVFGRFVDGSYVNFGFDPSALGP